MRAGERIGDYTIRWKIGEGGMSVVYLAEHASEGTQVVVKELKEQHRSNDQLVERFLREAEILQSLRHPHLARVFDVQLHDGKHCIIQEYLSGGSLADLLRENKSYSEQEAIRWCCDALRAMNYAHENGIVHRDLKPSNLMLDDRRQVRVIDFGIARAFGQERLTRTSDGSIGTLEYMSPEQILTPHKIDHLTDVYSMGIVLYELLSGSVPFEGPTPFSVQEKIAREAPPPLTRGREVTPLRADGSGIDPQLTKIVFRALEKRPDRRFGGCAEFALQLEQYLAGHPRGLTWALRPLVTLLLILIVALTAWWGYSSTSSDPGRREKEQQETERLAQIEKQREAERLARLQKQQEAEALAQIEKQREAERLAQIEKQREAEELAQIEKQREAERVAQIEKQREAERVAQLQKRQEAERLARLEKQQEAERLARLEKQQEAERLARLEKQQEAERLARLEKQQEAERLALLQKQQEAERLAQLQKQQEAERLAQLQKQQEAERLARLQKQQEAERLAQLEKQQEAERQRRLQQQRAAQFLRSIMGTWLREEYDRTDKSRTRIREVLNIGTDCSGVLTRTVTRYARAYEGWKEVDNHRAQFTIRCDATGRVWGDINTRISTQGEALLLGQRRFIRSQ